MLGLTWRHLATVSETPPSLSHIVCFEGGDKYKLTEYPPATLLAPRKYYLSVCVANEWENLFYVNLRLAVLVFTWRSCL